MNAFFALTSLIILVSTCNSENKAKEILIREAVSAIIEKDHSKILSIIDTTYCFEIYGKESFLNQLTFASNLIATCNDKEIPEKLIPIKNDYLNTVDYEMDFCNHDEMKNNKLKIKFSFFNHKSNKQISMIDFTFYTDLKSTKPNTPIPSN